MIAHNQIDDRIRAYLITDLIVYKSIITWNILYRFELITIVLANVFQMMKYTKRMNHFRENTFYSSNNCFIFIRNDFLYFVFWKSIFLFV